jgi:acyl-CoA synthetase (NDP forming)/RimJ/RimL family protein N-acetyltransferase
MTVPRLASAGRFNAARLFHPTSIAIIGADGAEIRAHMALVGFKGATQSVVRAEDLIAAPDLAVIATPESEVIPTMEVLATQGCFAAVVPGPAEDLAEAARRTGVRVLGPHAFGLAVPGIGLNASQAHIPVPAGRLALISQSIGLTRAVIDWARPHGVGFSHVIGVGGNADAGFGMALDWLSMDPGTGAILLEVGRIKASRALLSAARAASRYRPVVAFRSGPFPPDPDGTAALAFEAALRRSGVLTVAGLDDMLAAAETLSRAKPARAETLAILSDDPGVGYLAADAARSHGLRVIQAPEETLASLAADKTVGGVLKTHTPGEPIDVAALAAQARSLPFPVLICAMGQTTGGPLRRMLAEAGLAVFPSPERAVLGFLHLVRDRRNRAAARELPGSAVLPMAPDCEAVRRVFKGADGALPSEAVRTVFAAYGLPEASDAAIAVFEDAVFGPIIALGPERAMDLPPLNLTLAHALTGRAHLEDRMEMAETLVRVSQLVVDFPEIESLSFGPGSVATLTLRGPGKPPAQLAIAPYPSELAQPWITGDQHLTIRPIRPEDADAHAAFFQRLSPTDVRYRFFSAIHELSPERLARLTQVDYEREMAFIAVRDATNETVGVARLVSDTEGRAGEFAITVQTDMKGLGLATHLMHRLIDWARDRGLTEVIGQILSDNAPMLVFVRHLGFTLHRLPDEPEVMEARLSLRDDD